MSFDLDCLIEGVRMYAKDLITLCEDIGQEDDLTILKKQSNLTLMHTKDVSIMILALFLNLDLDNRIEILRTLSDVSEDGKL